VDVIGLFLAHRTGLDGLRQEFVDSVRRLVLMETGVALLQRPFGLVRHLVLLGGKHKQINIFSLILTGRSLTVTC
jgi:hypothetical protein